MKRKIIGLLQARTDSTRLPKKVLKTLLGKPMIIQELIRVKKSVYIDELVLVTSRENNDDELVELVEKSNFRVYRGSKDNVLERFYKCTQELKLNYNDIIVRLTGDCPVHDSRIIDELIDAFLKADVDYLANSVVPIYPDGLDAEVFTVRVLKQAYVKATKLSEMEHVTPFIRESGLFKVANLQKEVVHSEWRLTVDEPEDFVLIEKIYNHFQSNEFTFQEIVEYLENNINLLEINNKIKRNEGYMKSLKEDKIKNIKGRLILKPLSENFISYEYLTWMNDSEVLKYTESRWNSYSNNDLKLFIKKINNSNKDYLFGIYILESNKHIGNIKIGNINFKHEFAELGIIIGEKEEWGKGYATEAISLAISYAFCELKLYKIFAGAYSNNIGSIRALKKVGFQECGRYFQHCKLDKERVDTIQFEIFNKGINING